jgi:hypothetical protein
MGIKGISEAIRRCKENRNGLFKAIGFEVREDLFG